MYHLLRHKLIIFLFHRKVMFRSWVIQVFVFLTILRLTKSVWRHDEYYSTWDRVHFWIYLLNNKSLTHQTWSIDRYKQLQYFSESFWTIWRTGAKLQALFNLVTCSNYSMTNYVKFPVFHFVERVNKRELKMVNIMA